MSRLNDIAVIDVDTHYSEPHDLWTSRAPAKLRDRVPQTKVVDGQKVWVIDGDKVMMPASPASIIRKNGEVVLGTEFFGMDMEDVHPASYSVNERLAVMDETGVFAQVLYPNLLGFGGHRAKMFPEDLRLLSIEIFNDAMAELQEQSGNRLFPMALVPWWDMNAALKEVERCHGMGLRGINTNPDPQDSGLPDLGTEHWTPLWDLCVSLDIPVNFHIGASDATMDWFGTSPWPSLNPDHKLALGSAMMYLTNAKIVGNLIYSGVLERHPQLKFVSVESGVGWLPFMLEALDYQVTCTPASAWSHLSMTPSEYFRRQFYACFWFEKHGLAQALDLLGPDNIMFETDFPHPTCLYPNPLDFLAKEMADLPADVCRKVMGGNASALYHIDLPAA